MRFAIPLLASLSFAAAAPIPEIPRKIPPAGKALSEELTMEVKLALAHLVETARISKKRETDVSVVHKAIRFALENGEFYDPEKDLQKITALVRATDTPETSKHGLKIRGYRSEIDGSLQPYGIDIPEGLDLSKPAPVWIWLHGRGDKTTDLHFLHERLTKGGKFQPEDAIVLHPFGRQCIGWKHAGEIDVFDALADLATQYKIDPDRVALCGFSMGGAGAWHIGAHYTDRFAAVHAGAGFAETARYTKLKKEDYPSVWEQTLWGLYDVPNYARNLLNVPLIAYSGEEDKQIQAARVMEGALAGHGFTLKHVIGSKMGHKYAPASAKEIEGIIRAALAKGRDKNSTKIHLQTPTLRYNRMHWVTIDAPTVHWEEMRVDAEHGADGVNVTTTNVSALTLWLTWETGKQLTVQIDGTRLVAKTPNYVHLHRDKGGAWKLGRPTIPAGATRKKHGLQGPIDDAFMAPFIVATPDLDRLHDSHRRWVEFELAHFKKRWKELFRGELRTLSEGELTAMDHENFHIVVWGTPSSSGLIAETIGTSGQPLCWSGGRIRWPGSDDSGVMSRDHVVAAIQPNPRNPDKYLVINSGPTFREAHDRTNSLQNPKLGDWAIIDIRQDPDAESPGKVMTSGFFNNFWR